VRWLALASLLLTNPLTPSSGMARAPADRSAARAVLHEVLAQRAFAHARSESWASEFRRRIAEWLASLWARAAGNRFGRPSISRALAWIASAAAIAVLLGWLLRLARRKRRTQALELDAPVADERPWSALAQQAAELIRAGRIRDGARLAYRAAVQRLGEDGAFAHDPTRTPREYLRLVPEHHRRRPALSKLTAAFERIWYGSRPGSADEGHDIVQLLQELECLPREQAN